MDSVLKKINELAKKNFKVYQVAESAYAEARAEMGKHPKVNGADTAYLLKQLQVEKDFIEAREVYFKAKKSLEESMCEVNALRVAFAEQLAESNYAKPEDIDSNTMKLLESNILHPAEYEALMDGANPTMKRIIGEYAGRKAEEIAKRSGSNDSDAQLLRLLSYASKQETGSEALDAVNTVCNIYSRAVANPAMMGKWDSLVGELIEA